MDRADVIVLRHGVMEAHIRTRGAELVRLVHRTVGDLLWTPDPRYWGATSPILFPVIGRSSAGVIRVDGVDYPMPPHGFAASAEFTVAQSSDRSCVLTLAEDTPTQVVYPFRFCLRLHYLLEDASISCMATISNPGGSPLPAAFGFHPGLRWPLPGQESKAEHRLVFPDDDWLDCRRLRDAALAPEVDRLPLKDHRLPLDESLFGISAQVVLAYRSNTIHYRGGRGGIEIAVSRENLPQLGLWMKPGGDFICVEPWHGHTAPADFVGELRDRPGMFVLAPGEERHFAMNIAVHGDAPNA